MLTNHKTISEAAKWLDIVSPSWWDKISIYKLDMSDEYRCIIGQLFGPYDDIAPKLFGQDLYEADEVLQTEADEVFESIWGKNASLTEWKYEINTRKSLAYFVKVTLEN